MIINRKTILCIMAVSLTMYKISHKKIGPCSQEREDAMLKNSMK